MEYSKQPNLKSWAEDDRPREKFMLKGRSSLSDAELIAILISSGNREETAVDLSKRILNSVENNLQDLGGLDIAALKKFKGIGEAKAISIAAALELGRRRKASEHAKVKKISSSLDAFHLLEAELSDLPHEEFWVLLLNRANVVVGKKNISKGGVSLSLIHI